MKVRGREGSVLMEFVIVAPLYLVLLAGLFAVADLAVSRIRLHISDHFVTWVGGSRFCPLGEDGLRDGTLVQSQLRTLYDESIGGPLQENFFKVDSDRDDGTKINAFMGLYKGGVRILLVNVPSWVRGMMSSQDVVMNTGEDPMLGSTVGFSCDYERSFCFNRFGLASTPDFNRDRNAVSAQDVATCGYLNNVVSDSWISQVGDGTGSPSMSITVAQELPNGRKLGGFAE